MEIKFDVYFKKNLGTLFKSNEVDLNGKHAHVNMPLALVDRMEVNYLINGNKKYTDDVLITDITENLIQIPFKSDVLKVGLNEFEIIAYMKNGDIKTSQTYTYNIDEAIGEGIVSGGSGDGHSHTNLAILNSITQAKINEWNNKANKEHAHSDYAEKNHTHNANEIEGLENIDIDLSNYYTKSETDNFINNKADKGHTHNQYLTEHQDISHKADKENTYTKSQTDNKIVEEIAKAQIGGSGEVDLSAYATKNYVDDEISKIELKEGPQGPKGDKGDTGLTGPAYNDAELRSLIASLTKRVEELEKGNTNPPTEDEVKPVEAKSYCGQMNFKSVDIVTIEDLEGLANIVDVVKPQTTYAHSGSTVYNKTLICAIPKSKGSVSSVVDGAGVDITASYPVVEKTLNGVVYSISCNKVAQAYNKSTVVKFNIN